MAMKMARNASRGPLYTEFGVSIRCMRKDLTTQSVTLHYLSDGNCTLRFVIRKQEFLVPVIILLKVGWAILEHLALVGSDPPCSRCRP